MANLEVLRQLKRVVSDAPSHLFQMRCVVEPSDICAPAQPTTDDVEQSNETAPVDSLLRNSGDSVAVPDRDGCPGPVKIGTLTTDDVEWAREAYSETALEAAMIAHMINAREPLENVAAADPDLYRYVVNTAEAIDRERAAARAQGEAKGRAESLQILSAQYNMRMRESAAHRQAKLPTAAQRCEGLAAEITRLEDSIRRLPTPTGQGEDTK